MARRPGNQGTLFHTLAPSHTRDAADSPHPTPSTPHVFPQERGTGEAKIALVLGKVAHHGKGGSKAAAQKLSDLANEYADQLKNPHAVEQDEGRKGYSLLRALPPEMLAANEKALGALEAALESEWHVMAMGAIRRLEGGVLRRFAPKVARLLQSARRETKLPALITMHYILPHLPADENSISMGEIAPVMDEVLELGLEQLNHRNASKVASAFKGIGLLPASVLSKVSPRVAALLDHANARVRKAAAKCLAKLPAAALRTHADALAARLDDSAERWQVKREALGALEALYEAEGPAPPAVKEAMEKALALVLQGRDADGYDFPEVWNNLGSMNDWDFDFTG